MLGGNVGGLLFRRNQPVNGGDINDASPVLFTHGGQRQPAGVKHRRKVNGDNVVPFLHREGLHRRDMLYSGVVDKNVHAVKLRFGVAHHGFNLQHVTQVGIVVARLFAQLCNFFSR